MKKKIAVIVRDRQGEAFRMSLGLTLMDDILDIYVLDNKLEDDEEIRMNLDLIKEDGHNVYSNRRDNDGTDYLSDEEIANRLTEYDHVLPY